jgi:hydrogenase maturation factor
MDNDLILLGHGSGGRLSHQLLDELIIPLLSGTPPKGQNDEALLPPQAALPIQQAVRGVCAILGLDPLYVANLKIG